MSLLEFAEFVHLLRLPLLFGAAALIGAVLGLGFRDDSPRTEWPREEQR